MRFLLLLLILSCASLHAETFSWTDKADVAKDGEYYDTKIHHKIKITPRGDCRADVDISIRLRGKNRDYKLSMNRSLKARDQALRVIDFDYVSHDGGSLYNHRLVFLSSGELQTSNDAEPEWHEGWYMLLGSRDMEILYPGHDAGEGLEEVDAYLRPLRRECGGK